MAANPIAASRPSARPGRYSGFAAITKSDSVNFPDGICDAIYVGTAGVVAVVRWDGTVVEFTCIAGAELRVRAIRVNNTNTVPSLMVALYE